MAVSGTQKTRIGIGMAVGIALTISAKSPGTAIPPGPFPAVATQISIANTIAASISAKSSIQAQISIPNTIAVDIRNS